MPTNAQYLTLADWARRMDPQGQIDDIAEMLSQANEIYDDMIWIEGILPTGHKTTLRTSLPSGTWRLLYQGVPYGKSTTAQVTVGTGMLEAYSQIDRKLAEMSGNVAKFRYSEDNAFLEGLSQQMATTISTGIRPSVRRNLPVLPRFSIRSHPRTPRTRRTSSTAAGPAVPIPRFGLSAGARKPVSGCFRRGPRPA